MFDWFKRLETLNSIRLNHEELGLNFLPPQVPESRWLGYLGASEAIISETELRLDCTLPNSYKNFLRTSNGWSAYEGDICEFNLLPIEKIDWFKTTHGDYEWWKDCDEVSDEDYFVYGPDQDCIYFRPQYLYKSLQISSIMETGVILINPEVTTEDGEWEAIYLDAKLPGASRHRSFLDFMKIEPEWFYGYEPPTP